MEEDNPFPEPNEETIPLEGQPSPVPLVTPSDYKKEDELELTEDQWAIIVKEWNSRKSNPPSISELTKLVFGNPNLDGRSREGKAIRKKLAAVNITPRTSIYVPKDEIILNESQQEYIQNNYVTMKCVEMARVLFANPSISNLHAETRAIIGYVKTLDAHNSFEKVEDIPEGNYQPPRTVEGALKKINKYRHEYIDKEKLTGKQRKDINSLLGYLNTYRFNRQINTYGKYEDRELFESTFIRYTYDKFDLTEEEVDQYILLATEVVISASVQQRINMLSELLDDSSEKEDPKISMSLVEAINTAQTEYNQGVIRQQKLLDSLKIKRSEKEGKNRDSTASIINLVQLWKDEESRVKMIKFADKRKENLKTGIEELMTMEEIKCRIAGISIDEVLNG